MNDYLKIGLIVTIFIVIPIIIVLGFLLYKNNENYCDNSGSNSDLWPYCWKNIFPGDKRYANC